MPNKLQQKVQMVPFLDHQLPHFQTLTWPIHLAMDSENLLSTTPANSVLDFIAP
jgi:hypothetical protein